jgi:hypothetical protein
MIYFLLRCAIARRILLPSHMRTPPSGCYHSDFCLVLPIFGLAQGLARTIPHPDCSHAHVFELSPYG